MWQAADSTRPFQERRGVASESSLLSQHVARDKDGSGRVAEAPKDVQPPNGRELSIDLQEDAASYFDDVALESHPLSGAQSQVICLPLTYEPDLTLQNYISEEYTAVKRLKVHRIGLLEMRTERLPRLGLPL